jgi:acyl-coenzyme A thioesterase PaaI-like protein
MSQWDESIRSGSAFDPFVAWKPTPAESLTRQRAAARRLAEATRGVLEKLSGTSSTAEELEEVAEAVEGALARLRSGVDPDGPGGEEGYAEAALVADVPSRLFERSPFAGRANPVAPPLDMSVVDGEVVGHVICGRTYEGPPGHVHGGIVAGLFDEVLGAAQGLSGHAGMTGRLTVHYRKPTPLDTPLELRARPVRADGRKILVAGTLHAGGLLCAEGEGLFITIDRATVQALVARAIGEAASDGPSGA